MNTIKSFASPMADLIVVVSSVSANSVKRFFIAPISFIGVACSLAGSTYSLLYFSKIVLRVFSRANRAVASLGFQ